METDLDAPNHAEARRCYERALSHAPDLMEAHMALATSHKNACNSDRYSATI